MSYLDSSFGVMGLADLLQWLYASRKTGLCTFNHGPRTRRLYFEEGRLAAGESNEPYLLLGQFLISSGRIDPRVLHESMLIQERTGKNLGEILVASGRVNAEELQRLVEAKAEETVAGLFDWDDASFRFEPGVRPGPTALRVDVDPQKILFEGSRRVDEMREATEILHSPEIVLHKTGLQIDAPTIASYMGHHLWELIDGKRTLRELILACRTSNYLAYTFLVRLVERGLVRIGETRPVADPKASRDRADLAVSELQSLVSQERYEAAVELIDERAVPSGGHDLLAMLVAKAEAGFIANAYRTEMPPDAIPVLDEGRGRDEVVAGDLSPDESFLLDLIDGSWDVRSLVWIAPLRKVEVVRALLRLRRAGRIELTAPAHPAADESDQPPVDIDSAVDHLFDGSGRGVA